MADADIFQQLRRTTPFNYRWGFPRGKPIDRYYIERFLDAHRAEIRGRVLEVHDNRYTRRFGSAVTQTDILDIDTSNENATIYADLATADAIPAEQFDCFVLTQTLLLIYDVHAAVRHAHRILRTNGVLLVTVPSVTGVVPREICPADYWRFAPDACARLFGEVFGSENIRVQAYGNVLACIAFLMGLATEDLTQKELDAHDPIFPLLISVCAIKQ